MERVTINSSAISSSYSYSSAIFLLRVYRDSLWGSTFKVKGRIHRPRGYTPYTFAETLTSIILGSLSKTIRTLFWISVSNFVFPVMLSIVQIVIYMTSANYLLALYVEEVNFYLTIIGVIFATVWSTSTAWEKNRDVHQGVPMINIPTIPSMIQRDAWTPDVVTPRLSGERRAISLDAQRPNSSNAFSRSPSIASTSEHPNADARTSSSYAGLHRSKKTSAVAEP